MVWQLFLRDFILAVIGLDWAVFTSCGFFVAHFLLYQFLLAFGIGLFLGCSLFGLHHLPFTRLIGLTFKLPLAGDFLLDFAISLGYRKKEPESFKLMTRESPFSKFSFVSLNGSFLKSS